MTYITRDGKVYKQTISEVEVDIEAERYTLEAWKGALESDARELQEYQEKIAEIDMLVIPQEFKDKLKSGVFLSGSCISKEMVDEQEAKVSEIKKDAPSIEK